MEQHAGSSRPHAVVFPFPTQGHINPLMPLAKHLVNSGIWVTFIHTTRTFSMLQKTTHQASAQHQQDATSMLSFEVLPDSVAADGTTPVSPSVSLFITSIPVMKANFEKLLQRLIEEGHPASCIICDSFLPWTQDVADHFNVPRIEFWSSTATVYSMGFCVPGLLTRGYIPVKPGTDMETVVDFMPGIPSCRLTDLFYDLTYHPINSPVFQFLKEAFTRGKEAQRVIVNSMHHLEKDVVKALHEQGIPMDPIGPFLSSVEVSRDKAAQKLQVSTSLLAEDEGSLEWLDMHPRASVIYAAFGSNVKVPVDEIRELALGLEDSQQPFLLVIRPDLVPNGTFVDILPDGFLERTRGRGRISSWAPQFSVLGNPSVGGFISHCGWNSLLESMWMGVPVIGAPQESEQNTNLMCLLEWKAAIALDRSQRKVELKRDLVKKAITTLMHEQEGDIARKGMWALREAARYSMEEGQSKSNLGRLVQDIKEMASGNRPSFFANKAL